MILWNFVHNDDSSIFFLQISEIVVQRFISRILSLYQLGLFLWWLSVLLDKIRFHTLSQMNCSLKFLLENKVFINFFVCCMLVSGIMPIFVFFCQGILTLRLQLASSRKFSPVASYTCPKSEILLPFPLFLLFSSHYTLCIPLRQFSYFNDPYFRPCVHFCPSISDWKFDLEYPS